MDAAEKTLAVLDALAVRADRLADIAARAGVPRSTAHRILQRLVDRGYARPAGDGRYVAGPRVLALAGDALAELDRVRTRPVLEALRDDVGHTVHFALLTGAEATYVEKLEARDSGYQMASRVGMRLALHTTAIGKAILAALPDDERRAVLRGRGRMAHSEVERIRALGYAVDDQQNERNVRCVGAAVLDQAGRPIGAVSVSALTLDLSLDDVPSVGQRVAAAAAELSQAAR
jgi:IclR family transcriptional regulator, acetate operon repressor